MRVLISKTIRWAAIAAVAGFASGYVGEAAAIDRQPAVRGVSGNGSRGYGAERPRAGAERPGYGMERQYYGASNVRAAGERAGGHERGRYRSHGSMIEFDDRAAEFDGADALDSNGGSRAGVYPGYGAQYDGSVVEFDDDGQAADESADRSYLSSPKIIDVASERLDRYRAPKGSVSVSYVGTAKIIRIGSGIGEPERREAKPALAPWSESWQRYCSRAYPDFDAERGTYTADDGSTRFCTGS